MELEELGLEKMKAQPRSEKGTFRSQYKERRGEAIALRLPESLDEQVRKATGWKSRADNPKLKEWIEQAIRDRLSKEKKKST